MSEEVSQLFEILQRLVRDHHVGAIPQIQGGGAMGRSLVAGAICLGEQLLSSLHHMGLGAGIFQPRGTAPADSLHPPGCGSP
eukprot:9029795-Pyramimonas_sp.AAC.1